MDDLRFGLLYQQSFLSDFKETQQNIDFLEIVVDNLWPAHARKREVEIPQGYELLAHSLHLSLGSSEPLNGEYLRRVAASCRLISPRWLSDHLAVTRIGSLQIDQLSPIRYHKSLLAMISEKIDRIQQETGLQFLVENIARYFQIPGTNMTEQEFFAELVQRSKCGLLLDVNNLYVSAVNLHFDPLEYLAIYPIAAVKEIHIAGHRSSGGMAIDSHGEAVASGVTDLLLRAVEGIPSAYVLLERDQNIPPLADMTTELTALRESVRRPK